MADCRICVQDCSIHEDVWKALKENCRNYKPKPMTNGDRLRAMSDEELANSKVLCPYTAYDMDMCEKWIISSDTRDCAACALDWLRQKGE